MQLAADALSFLLLRVQNLMGQMPQLFLHMMRLLQQPALVLLAFLEGFLHRPPPGQFPGSNPRWCQPGPPGGVGLLSLLAEGNVSERDPAPFLRPRERGCDRGPKAWPKKWPPPSFRKQYLTVLVLGPGKIFFRKVLKSSGSPGPHNAPGAGGLAGKFHAEQSGARQVPPESQALSVNRK